MSWFTNAYKAVKKGVTDVGHFAGKALSNPIVEGGLGLLTGGATIPLLAGAAGGLLRPGGNIGRAAVGGLEGGAVGGLGSAARGLIPGVGGVVGAGSAASAVPAGIAAGGGDIAAPVAAQVAGGGASNGLLSGVGGLIRKAASNPGAILTAAQGVNSALDAASARSLENKAMGYSVNDYNARAPLRSAGIAGLTAAPVSLAGNRAYSSVGNPYATDPKPTKRILGVTRRQASS